MTLSELITLADRRGYLFDEQYFSHTGDYKFITTFDGHSAEAFTFDSKRDAERYFTDAERFAE